MKTGSLIGGPRGAPRLRRRLRPCLSGAWGLCARPIVPTERDACRPRATPA